MAYPIQGCVCFQCSLSTIMLMFLCSNSFRKSCPCSFKLDKTALRLPHIVSLESRLYQVLGFLWRNAGTIRPYLDMHLPFKSLSGSPWRNAFPASAPPRSHRHLDHPPSMPFHTRFPSLPLNRGGSPSLFGFAHLCQRFFSPGNDLLCTASHAASSSRPSFLNDSNASFA